ncbi:MAG: flagellar motor protein MotA [Devosiaceae bacterium]
MADSADPHSLSRPTIYLALMAVFVALAGFLALILYRPISTAFAANPGLNGLIIGVLLLGIVLAVFQVIRLMPEIRWVNAFRLVDHGAGLDQPNPRLLSQLGTYLRDSQGTSGPTMSTQTVRSILESVGTRLDEGREILRYMIGLLVFLGLLGTFWGLTQTIASVGDTIDGLDVNSGDFGTIFENLKTGLAAPLDGMGTAFSSSLFGLAGSLVLGFLDLQAGQAQNRFYTELEDWLSNLAGVDVSQPGAESGADNAIVSLERSVDRLARQVAAQNQLVGAKGTSGATGGAEAADVKQSIDSLAAGVQSLVQHMRSEQQMLRDWVEEQGEHTQRLATVMEDVAKSMSDGRPGRTPGE